MNQKTDNLLNKRIMKRVYSIWFAKKVIPYFLAELSLFVGFVYLIAHFVYISQVLRYADQILANNSVNPVVWFNFMSNTFLQTEFIVQLSVLGSLLAIVFAFRTFIMSLVQLNIAKEETNLAGQSLLLL